MIEHLENPVVIGALISAIAVLLTPIISTIMSILSKVKIERLEKITSMLSATVTIEKEIQSLSDDSVASKLKEQLDKNIEAINSEYFKLKVSHFPLMKEIPKWKRILLLYRPITAGGWISHILFYLFIYTGASMLIVGIPITIEEGSQNVSFIIFTTITYFLLALAMNRLSCSLYRRKEKLRSE